MAAQDRTVEDHCTRHASSSPTASEPHYPTCTGTCAFEFLLRSHLRSHLTSSTATAQCRRRYRRTAANKHAFPADSLVAFADDGRGMAVVTNNRQMFHSFCHWLWRSSKLGLQRRQWSKVLATERTLNSCLARRTQLVFCPYLHAPDVHTVATAISVHSACNNVTISSKHISLFVFFS